MAEWREGSRLLFVGRSGLQYKAQFTCLGPVEGVFQTAKRFLAASGAVPEHETATEAQFIRGSHAFSWWSWLLILSERSARQTIALSCEGHPRGVLVSLAYDVDLRYTIVTVPNFVEREARRLKIALQAGDYASLFLDTY